jgi:putative transcriptional regulator
MTSSKMIFVAYLVLSLAGFFLNSAARAKDDIEGPVILVARPDFNDPLFGSTVLIVIPIGNRQHLGFIINRPTVLTVSDVFPDHAPSRKVTQPIYLGGPENLEAVFALVQRPARAANSGIKFTPDLYLETEWPRLHSVIENEHQQARFFIGAVVWLPGELNAEVRNEYWHVLNADAELVLRDPSGGMWEEMIKRIERAKKTVTAQH